MEGGGVEDRRVVYEEDVIIRRRAEGERTVRHDD